VLYVHRDTTSVALTVQNFAKHRVVASLVRGFVVALVTACGVTPEPEIADQFHQRLSAPPEGWAPTHCPDRDAKVEDLREVIGLAHDLRARIREFDSPLPPRLDAALMQTPLLGRGDAYRCVIRDFQRIDLRTEPNYAEVVGFTASLFMVKAATLMARGEADEGWAHVLEALTLYAIPGGPSVAEQGGVLDVLTSLQILLETHPPNAATVTRLIDAVDATLVPSVIACAGVRHELLAIAVAAFRVHFDRREKEAMASRFGLDFAMRSWRDHRAGQLERTTWNAFRDVYDAVVDGCTRRPYGQGLKRAATAQARLDLLHPPTGVQVRVATDRLNRAGTLVDAQTAMLATLRALQLRSSLGREPTTTELALSFGRRPHNPWDGRPYTFTMNADALVVQRGPYREELALPPVRPRTRVLNTSSVLGRPRPQK